MIDLNRRQPIDEQRKMVRKKINKSLRKDAPKLEKEIIDDSSLRTVWDENRKPKTDILKIGILVYLIVEFC